VQRRLDDGHILKQKETESKNRVLEDLAREDVAKYIKKCKDRNRKSLAFRAKEKRLHLQLDREKKENEQFHREENSLMQSLDAKYVQLAKEKERARNALHAMRHKGCTFSSNPFASLLD